VIPRRPLVVFTLFSLLPSTFPVVAAPAPPAQGFNDTTQVTAIEIPVQVTRDGEPVRGLKVSDFEVTEGKTKRPIVGFDVVDLESTSVEKSMVAGAPAKIAAPALAGRRHLLLLFDLGNSDPQAVIKAEKAIEGVALKDLTPNDLVAVATYSPADGTRLLLNFTTNRQQLVAALQHVGLPPAEDRAPDPLRLLAEVPLPTFTPGANQARAGNPGAAARDSAADYLAHSVQQQARADREAQLQMVGAMTRAYADLARLMASISGRKEVVLLSQGFDPALLQGSTGREQESSTADLQNDEKVVWVDSDQRFGNTHQSNALEKTLEAFRRADCVIQAVNIGGLRATGGGPSGGTSAGQSSLAMQKLGVETQTASDNGLAAVRANGDAGLFQMARDTGGELYQNFNDLGVAVRRLLQRTSVTYLLTIQPEGLVADGSFHPLKVALKQAPRGTQISARPGYYAPARSRKPSELERTLAAGNELMSADGSGTVSTAVLALPFRSHGAKAYVPVLIEADGGTLLGDMLATAVSAPTVPAEIYSYALSEDGSVADFFVQVLGLDLGKVGETVRSTGLKFFGHMELAPGKYEIRTLVRNGLSGAYGVSVEPLNVPDFSTSSTVLLRPLFLEPFDKWLMVREGPRGELKGEPYPFMAGDQAYSPASLPKLTSGQTATLELVGWNLGAVGAQTTGRVLNREGKEVVAGGVRLDLDRPVASQAGPATVRTHFVTPKLPVGTYELVIDLGPQAKATAGGHFAVVEDPFRSMGGGG
jgi:VWFA-related protein